jgi:hypothetical protein
MGNSWNHNVAVMSQEQRAYYIRQQLTCSRRCPNPVEFFAHYSYVTGRRGRVSHAKRPLCAAHAAGFARRYNVPFPAPVTTTEQPN